jgi:hypothetical protein
MPWRHWWSFAAIGRQAEHGRNNHLQKYAGLRLGLFEAHTSRAPHTLVTRSPSKG